MNKTQYRYNRIRPTRGVDGSNFNGEIQFEFASTSDVRLDLQNAYIEVRGSLTNAVDWELGDTPTTDATGADLGKFDQTRAKNNGFCQNPFTTLFKSAVLYVNDKEVSRSHQFSAESTHLKMTMMNNSESVNDTSPFVPVKFNNRSSYGTTASYINASTVVKDTKLALMNDQNVATMKILKKVYPELDSNLIAVPNTPKVLQFRMSHPLAPLFIQEDPEEALYASKIRLTLQVDPDHLKKLCIATLADPVLTLGIDDLFFNIPTFQSNIGPPAGVSYSSKFMEAHSSLRTMTGTSDSFQVSLPSAMIKYVMISFSSTSISALVDNNYYTSCFAVGEYINTLYINFANRTYPAPQYSFPNDYLRAYDDYYHISSAKQMGEGTLMTFSQWLQTPVFMFAVLPNEGNQSNILDVNVTADSALATRQIILTTWYDKQLNISYGESGQVVDTSVQYVN